MADLKPCPFCEQVDCDIHFSDGVWWVMYCRCDAEGPSSGAESAAIAAWNQRAGWRDIASAPKDGSDILAYLPNFDCRSVVHWARINNSGHWYDGWHVVNPTHWQPLPEPPKEGGANGK